MLEPVLIKPAGQQESLAFARLDEAPHKVRIRAVRDNPEMQILVRRRHRNLERCHARFPGLKIPDRLRISMSFRSPVEIKLQIYLIKHK